MGFKLADLFVDIRANEDPLRRSLDGVKRHLSSWSVAMGTFTGNLMSDALRTAFNTLGAGVGVLGDSVNKASELNETLSKVGVVFGPGARQVTGMAEEMAKKFGASRVELLDAASVFGLMAKGAGLADGETVKFSTNMARLAADASSFYNVDLATALEKIRAGLSGEAEPLRAFGVFLSDAAMKSKAAQMGIGGLNGELTEGQKILVRSALITEGLAAAQGDLARTSGGFANQSRGFWGRVNELMTSLGQALLPAATTMMRALNALAVDIGSSMQEWAPAIEAFANRLANGGRYVALLWRDFPAVWEWMTLKAGDAFAAVGALARNLFVGLATSLGDLFGQVGKSIGAAMYNGVAEALNRILDDPVARAALFVLNPGLAIGGKMKRMAVPDINPKGLGDLFANMPAANPQLAKIEDRLNQLVNRQLGGPGNPAAGVLGGAGVLGLAVPAGAGAMGGAPAAGGGGGGGRGAAPAAEAQGRVTGLVEFARSLQEGVFGKNRDAARTADAAVQQVALLGQIKDRMVGGGALGGVGAVAIAAP